MSADIQVKPVWNVAVVAIARNGLWEQRKSSAASRRVHLLLACVRDKGLYLVWPESDNGLRPYSED